MSYKGNFKRPGEGREKGNYRGSKPHERSDNKNRNKNKNRSYSSSAGSGEGNISLKHRSNSSQDNRNQSRSKNNSSNDVRKGNDRRNSDSRDSSGRSSPTSTATTASLSATLSTTPGSSSRTKKDLEKNKALSSNLMGMKVCIPIQTFERNRNIQLKEPLQHFFPPFFSHNFNVFWGGN